MWINVKTSKIERRKIQKKPFRLLNVFSKNLDAKRGQTNNGKDAKNTRKGKTTREIFPNFPRQHKSTEGKRPKSKRAHYICAQRFHYLSRAIGIFPLIFRGFPRGKVFFLYVVLFSAFVTIQLKPYNYAESSKAFVCTLFFIPDWKKTVYPHINTLISIIKIY